VISAKAKDKWGRVRRIGGGVSGFSEKLGQLS
jgi:hypothetical protein